LRLVSAAREDGRIVTLTCLIVDDSADFLSSAARLLEAEGMRVVGLCHTSQEALDLLATVSADVILVDVELGDEDGVQVAEVLAESAPSALVVLVSSRDRDELRASLENSRFESLYLPKAALSASAITALLAD
jgi:two-component system nitrate/nitrite response regulator NarL